ncbi:hypothetical protein D3C85_566000 [compost metagenome]
MSSSYYAELLKGSFESLKSATEPGMRSSGGSMIDLKVSENPVLDKVVPVKESVRKALQVSGYLIKGDGTLDVGEEDGPTPAVKPSLESSGHDPLVLAAMVSNGQLPKESNLVVNGVHLAESVTAPTKTVSIMTPNDVIDPEADVLYLAEDDEYGSTKEYLSTEGYKVATTTDELLVLLRS